LPVDAREMMVLEDQVIAFAYLVPFLLAEVKVVSLVSLVDDDVPFVRVVLLTLEWNLASAHTLICMSCGEVLLCHYPVLRSSPK